MRKRMDNCLSTSFYRRLLNFMEINRSKKDQNGQPNLHHLGLGYVMSDLSGCKKHWIALDFIFIAINGIIVASSLDQITVKSRMSDKNT